MTPGPRAVSRFERTQYLIYSLWNSIGVGGVFTSVGNVC
mgnify:CR=1 FL=1